ncbi:MAG: hypothetical protein OXH06_02150 [Gemmatimonadetes bacterium]|nr:hypothetical protein [Gemmatimonadota bacterium]
MPAGRRGKGDAEWMTTGDGRDRDAGDVDAAVAETGVGAALEGDMVGKTNRDAVTDRGDSSTRRRVHGVGHAEMRNGDGSNHSFRWLKEMAKGGKT